MDESLGIMLVSVIVSVLYSFAKPDAWSGKRKESVAALLSLAVGAVYAVVVGRDALGIAELVGLAFATQQAFYRLLAEKLGIEQAVRTIKGRLK